MESLGKLAGGVAHDFNNIMAIIVNYTEFAAEQSAGNDAVQADLAQVRTAADRAINLTSQLLTFTRGDAVQPRDVDLNAAVAEVKAMLERTIGEHITLIAMPCPEPLTVHADAGHIQQVLLNLALNARDSMPDGGTLVIEANSAVHGRQRDSTCNPPLQAGAYARLAGQRHGRRHIRRTSPRTSSSPSTPRNHAGEGTGLGPVHRVRHRLRGGRQHQRVLGDRSRHDIPDLPSPDRHRPPTRRSTCPASRAVPRQTARHRSRRRGRIGPGPGHRPDPRPRRLPRARRRRNGAGRPRTRGGAARMRPAAHRRDHAGDVRSRVSAELLHERAPRPSGAVHVRLQQRAAGHHAHPRRRTSPSWRSPSPPTDSSTKSTMC